MAFRKMTRPADSPPLAVWLGNCRRVAGPDGSPTREHNSGGSMLNSLFEYWLLKLKLLNALSSHRKRLRNRVEKPRHCLIAIDTERRKNAFGLLMSLNMLIETPAGFDYTGEDCCGWMREAGFRETYVEPLVGGESMVVGIK
jgi:hypothetical protein